MKLLKEELSYKGAKVKILTDKKRFADIAAKEMIKQREILEKYIAEDKDFLDSLKPIEIKSSAPEIVKKMAEGAKIAGVGPMAAVAGTIAEYMAKAMVKAGAKTAVVENGGDIFAVSNRKIVIGLYAGYTKLSDKLAFGLDKKNTPISICSSSKMGHSLSFGDCDLATVFSRKAAVADGVATAVANKVKKQSDIQPTLEWANGLKDVDGVLIVKEDKIGMIGNIPKLLKNEDALLKEKVTKEDFYRL